MRHTVIALGAVLAIAVVLTGCYGLQQPYGGYPAPAPTAPASAQQGDIVEASKQFEVTGARLEEVADRAVQLRALGVLSDQMWRGVIKPSLAAAKESLAAAGIALKSGDGATTLAQVGAVKAQIGIVKSLLTQATVPGTGTGFLPSKGIILWRSPSELSA